MATDRTQLIARLAAAFPQREIGPETVGVYVRALADIPPEELEPVVSAYMLEAEWFPTIRDLRRAVVERRLQLPGVDQAWAQALEWAATPAKIDCYGCEGSGVLAGGQPVELDRDALDTIQDPVLRGMLEQIVESASRPTHLCDICEGRGEIPNPGRVELARPVRQAVEHIGGAAGINATENLGILRAQFLKAYDRSREDTLRTENLTSAGYMLDAPPPRAAIEEGTRP